MIRDSKVNADGKLHTIQKSYHPAAMGLKGDPMDIVLNCDQAESCGAVPISTIILVTESLDVGKKPVLKRSIGFALDINRRYADLLKKPYKERS